MKSTKRTRFTKRARSATAAAVLAVALLATGCAEGEAPTAPPLQASPSSSPQSSEVPPEVAGALATVSFGAASLELWPFTGRDFSGEPSDPVNLLFVGEADPAAIRAALLALDGDRTAFGAPFALFDCRWRDAAGGLQTNWAGGRWSGSTVQLECGDYQSVRFHLRLFPAGEWTAANAHFEVLIPGTTDHQVLSWDLAKHLVRVDLMRTALLDPAEPFGQAEALTPSPTFREIPPVIYNGLPPFLQALAGGPPAPVTEPVGMRNDGTALIANLAERAAVVPGPVRYEFTVPFDQTIPKPFCSQSQADWMHAAGPVSFIHQVSTDPAGEVSAQIQVVGELEVTPVDLATGLPAGPTRSARITDHYTASTRGHGGRISATQLRLITAAFGTGEVEREQVRLRVGPGGLTDHRRTEHCSG